jgi:hypothetical protein
MSDSEIFAVLGRIHVILRREGSRITDIEWARSNRDYAREIVRLCRHSKHPDLAGLAARLAGLLHLEPAVNDAGRLAATDEPAENPDAESTGTEPRYLSGLR